LPISNKIETLQMELEKIRVSGIDPDREGLVDLLEQIEILSRTDPENACVLAEQTLAISRKSGFEVECAKSLRLIGISYSQRGEYEKALDNSLKALAIYNGTDDSAGLSSTLNTIGVIYRNRDDSHKALEYYSRSLEISEKIGDKKRIATTTNNIGVIYQSLNEWERALEFAEKSLQSFTELGNDLGIASSCNNVGTILQYQGDHSAAKEYFLKAYEILQRIGYKTGLSASCNNLGEMYMRQEDFKKAGHYFHQALEAAIEADAKERILYSYEYLSNLHETMGDFRTALQYYEKYSNLNQQVFSEESTRNMIQLQIKFETEKKKKEAEIYRLKNIELRNEISERIHIEEVLRKHQEQLEDQINDRTVELIDSFNKLERSFQGSIVLISKITELRDPYTSGHQIRVAKLASAIAKELNLPEEKVEAINIAALVHDIGKINIPQEILSKPGVLSNLEMRMIQIHPEAGYSILSEINFPWPIAEIVREHHEHFNGSGYPQGLKADEIMIEARIICVADVLEAMSSHRPYRPVLGLDEAVREITENENVLYDGNVVNACRTVIINKGFSFSFSTGKGNPGS